MSDWIEWNGGECPVPLGSVVEVKIRSGDVFERVASCIYWKNFSHPDDSGDDVIAYRIFKEDPEAIQGFSSQVEQAVSIAQIKGDAGFCDPWPTIDFNESGGGKLSGDHYYRVNVSKPIAPDVAPYTAECADIIEALNMTFNEGEAFKALWRLAASRQGRVKDGSKGMQYDADKVAHYGARVAVQTSVQMEEARK